MKTRTPDYYKEFKCIAGDCEDTCCAGWEIVIDDKSYEKYRNVKGNFGERLKNEITEDEDGEKIFMLKGDRCAFLNNMDLCDIYKELGEDALCYTCTEYPRFTEEFGSIREKGLSVSCPEAARIMFKNTPLPEFELSEDDGTFPEFNDINVNMYIQILASRKILFKIIKNENLKLREKMSLMLRISQEIQEKIDDEEVKEIEEVRNNYKDESFIKNLLEEFKIYENKTEIKFENLKEMFEVYKSLDHINEKCLDILKDSEKILFCNLKDAKQYKKELNEFELWHKERDYIYDKLLMYFTYRYFLKTVFDYDASAKIKFALTGILIIKNLMLALWIKNGKNLSFEEELEIIREYSKDIEHSDENIEMLYEYYETNETFCLRKLLSCIN